MTLVFDVSKVSSKSDDFEVSSELLSMGVEHFEQMF